jgi:hypothetical protein
MRPCAVCVHNEDGGGDAACLGCKQIAPDNFTLDPQCLCASCQYDPRLHGVCERCVDFDKYELKGGGK